MDTNVLVALLAFTLFVLYRRSAIENFLQPVLVELDFGKSQYQPSKETVKERIAERTAQYKVQDGAKIEYFFKDDLDLDPHDPMQTTYKRVTETDANANVFGPRAWYDTIKYDDSGTVPYTEIEKDY